LEASFYFLCKLVEGSGTVLVSQRTELEHNASKADAFIGCVYWKIVAFSVHIFDAICPCSDDT
jgi:hypothetical protein